MGSLTVKRGTLFYSNIFQKIFIRASAVKETKINIQNYFPPLLLSYVAPKPQTLIHSYSHIYINASIVNVKKELPVQLLQNPYISVSIMRPFFHAVNVFIPLYIVSIPQKIKIITAGIYLVSSPYQSAQAMNILKHIAATIYSSGFFRCGVFKTAHLVPTSQLYNPYIAVYIAVSKNPYFILYVLEPPTTPSTQSFAASIYSNIYNFASITSGLGAQTYVYLSPFLDATAKNIAKPVHSMNIEKSYIHSTVMRRLSEVLDMLLAVSIERLMWETTSTYYSNIYLSSLVIRQPNIYQLLSIFEQPVILFLSHIAEQYTVPFSIASIIKPAKVYSIIFQTPYIFTSLKKPLPVHAMQYTLLYAAAFARIQKPIPVNTYSGVYLSSSISARRSTPVLVSLYSDPYISIGVTKTAKQIKTAVVYIYSNVYIDIAMVKTTRPVKSVTAYTYSDPYISIGVVKAKQSEVYQLYNAYVAVQTVIYYGGGGERIF